MFTDAYRGRGVSRFMCTYALTLSLFMFLSYGVWFYLQKCNFTFIQKGCVCQKWLFFSNEINFCCNEISFFFTLNGFSEPNLAKTVLILIKYILRHTLNFSVTSYFEKILYSGDLFERCLRGLFERDLFQRLFYIDIYRRCFILMLLLLLLLFNVIAVAVS